MGINIIGDYHTHTNIPKGKIIGIKNFYEHAKGSIRENALIAERRGLKEIAITDHGYKQILFGIDKSFYKQIRKYIDELNDYYKCNNKDFRVLLGVESNIVNKNGDIDVKDEFIDYLDIICAGYHDGSIADLNLKKNYTLAAINAINKYNITILNHPVEKVNVDILEVGKAAIKQNTALEINRKHENISVDDIKKLKELGAMFSIGSDSHKSRLVGRFGMAYTIAFEAGLNNDDIINADGEAHIRMKRLKEI